MSAATRDLLTNRDVIAVNQDWAGIQGHRISKNGDLEVWTKPTSAGGAAVALFNRGTDIAEMTTAAADLGLRAASAYKIHDLWTGLTLFTPGDVKATVPGHGAKMFVVSPVDSE